MLETMFWGVPQTIAPAQPGQVVAVPAPFDVFAIGNSVYFNGVVTTDSIQRLIRLSQEIIAKRTKDSKPDYHLYINSCGGYVSEMFRFADFVENEIVPNTNRCVSIVHGVAMSAASFMAASFPERWITKRSRVMIHELWTFNGGNFTALSSYVKSLGDCMDLIVDTYSKATGKSGKEIRACLLKESYYGAAQAKKFGLVQKII